MIKQVEIENDKRVKLTGKETTVITFNRNIQGLDILVMGKGNVYFKVATKEEDLEEEINEENLECYLLNDFCKGLKLYQSFFFNTLIFNADEDVDIQFLNIV